eukprot:evm.model.scf_81.4 EVM.evm.TU.scf_81.4   scf_81:52896-58685(-)
MAGEQLLLDEPNETTLGSAGWVKYVENGQGLSLCRYFWPTQGQPKGVVLVCHGHGAHTCFEYLRITKPGEPQAYSGSWVEALNNAGFSVAGLDHQGCGRSQGQQGKRCFFLKYDDYVDEVLDFARWLQTSPDAKGFSGVGMFILGISMGGCTCAYAIHREPSLFKGAVLLAPMLSLEKIAKKGLNPYLKPIASLLSWAVPALPVAENGKNTKFPAIQEAFDKDPGTWTQMTRARVANEYLRVTSELTKLFPSMEFPFLCIHSKEDTFTDPEGSALMHEKAQSKDKTLHLIDDMWHFLMHEPGNEKVQEIVLEWLKQRC